MASSERTNILTKKKTSHVRTTSNPAQLGRDGGWVPPWVNLCVKTGPRSHQRTPEAAPKVRKSQTRSPPTGSGPCAPGQDLGERTSPRPGPQSSTRAPWEQGVGGGGEGGGGGGAQATTRGAERGGAAKRPAGECGVRKDGCAHSPGPPSHRTL